LTGIRQVIISFFLAIIGSALFIMMCHKFAKFLTWLVLFLVVSALFIVSYFCVTFDASVNFLNTSQNALFEKSVHYLGYAIAIGAEFILIFIVMLRKRIEIAVEIVREASKALKDMPLIFAIPIIFFSLAGGYTILWIFIALNIFSVAVDKTSNVPASIAPYLGFSTYQDYTWDSSMRNFLAFHFFHYLWFTQFLKYAGYLTISGALADWYFSKTDENGKKVRGNHDDELEKRPVWSSLLRMLRYNTGTVAFASMLLAIIQFIRAMVAYLERNAALSGNIIQKTLLCVLECVLKCFECCIDKLNKQALIYCSIYGSGLCVSAYRAFQISWKNLFRVAAVTMVTEFLMVVGKLTIAAVVTAISVLVYMKDSQYSEMSSFLLPGVIIFVMSYMVASMILLLYEASIDCIFFCFLVDFENNKGEGMFASDEMIAIVDKNAAKSKKAAMKKVMWRKEYGDKVKGGKDKDDDGAPKLDRMDSQYKSKAAVRRPPMSQDDLQSGNMDSQAL
jgi:choline transporter-like protein 2/4/5